MSPRGPDHPPRHISPRYTPANDVATMQTKPGGVMSPWANPSPRSHHSAAQCHGLRLSGLVEDRSFGYLDANLALTAESRFWAVALRARSESHGPMIVGEDCNSRSDKRIPGANHPCRGSNCSPPAQLGWLASHDFFKFFAICRTSTLSVSERWPKSAVTDQQSFKVATPQDQGPYFARLRRASWASGGMFSAT